MSLLSMFKAIYSKPEPRYLQGARPSTERETLVRSRIAKKSGNTKPEVAALYKSKHLTLMNAERAVRNG